MVPLTSVDESTSATDDEDCSLLLDATLDDNVTELLLEPSEEEIFTLLDVIPTEAPEPPLLLLLDLESLD
jgi:hypothetical protein